MSEGWRGAQAVQEPAGGHVRSSRSSRELQELQELRASTASAGRPRCRCRSGSGGGGGRCQSRPSHGPAAGGSRETIESRSPTLVINQRPTGFACRPVLKMAQVTEPPTNIILYRKFKDMVNH